MKNINIRMQIACQNHSILARDLILLKYKIGRNIVW